MEFKRCYGCMEELAVSGGFCPRCGYDNTNDPKRQPTQALSCGTVLNGRYVIGKVLGQGGFGITYLAFNLGLESPVCIKEYFPAGAAMRSTQQSGVVAWSAGVGADALRQGRESIVKEARKAVKLRELRSVVKVWDVFYENETAYLVMDYVDGKPLSAWLRHGGRPLSEAECIQLFVPVLADLARIHEAGIIHRDIKPDNLMVKPDGSLVLLDFGAAKDLSGGSGQSSFMVASQGFSPLEQYSRKGQIGPWTDVYALCATMIYCCTGRLIPESMDRINGEELDLNCFTPAVRAVLEQGLALQPAQRIQTTTELSARLEAAISGKAEPEKPPVTPPPEDGGANGLPSSGKQAPQTQEETLYRSSCDRMRTSVTPEEYRKTAEAFSRLQGYKDSSEKSAQCLLRAQQLELESQPRQNAAPPPRKTVRKPLLICAAVLTVVIACFFLFVHNWTAPTCTEPEKCTICGKVRAPALGHDFTAATCTTPQKCKVCGAIGIAALGHAWQPATYDKPETCSRCGLTRGNVKEYVGDVLGSWGVEQYQMREGFSTNIYTLDHPLESCMRMTMSFSMADYTGYPFGVWYLYARDLDGHWSHIAEFEVTEAVVNGNWGEFMFEFSPAVSFDALAVIERDRNIYSATTYVDFYDAQVYEG